MPEIGSSLSSTRTIYGGTAETGFCTCCVQCFLLQSALAFPMRTKDDSGMFCGGQFSVVEFAFFVEFTNWTISVILWVWAKIKREHVILSSCLEAVQIENFPKDGKKYCL